VVSVAYKGFLKTFFSEDTQVKHVDILAHDW